MSAPGRGQAANPAWPEADSWVAAVHASEHDLVPLGTAVVVDRRRVLTCAHVVRTGDPQLPADDRGVRAGVWVAFPKAETAADERRPVVAVGVGYAHPVTDPGEPLVRDLAVLHLGEDVPSYVEAAPLRCPRPAEVVGKRWSAFGFPDPYGSPAQGTVLAALARGWLLLDVDAGYVVETGFSGGGLWSPEYEAVVAIVGQARAGGAGRAITLFQADLCLTGQKLRLLSEWSVRAAGEVAQSAWGWSLRTDVEGVRHWKPRARGVSVDSEQGYRFRGRRRALTEIAAWLGRPLPDRRVLVVTGSPGVGKSAVLGRVVTTSDPELRALLPAGDDGVRAGLRSVACAVHAKGKTALEVAAEIARAASARLPGEPGDLAPALREALAGRGYRFNVVIDALDEAAGAAQARAIVGKVVLPAAETCADVGA